MSRKAFDIEEAFAIHLDNDVRFEVKTPGRFDYFEEGDSSWIGKRIWSRKIEGKDQFCGIVTGVSSCRLSGCDGLRLHVKWFDGKRTYPCLAGCMSRGGDLEIW